MNLTTLRVWCYACAKEVFLERKLGPNSPHGNSKALTSAPSAAQVTLHNGTWSCWTITLNAGFIAEVVVTHLPDKTSVIRAVCLCRRAAEPPGAPPPWECPLVAPVRTWTWKLKRKMIQEQEVGFQTVLLVYSGFQTVTLANRSILSLYLTDIINGTGMNRNALDFKRKKTHPLLSLYCGWLWQEGHPGVSVKTIF